MRPQFNTNQISLNEPEAIRSLTKKKIYEQLAEEYLLPKITCRAITREYLSGVYTGAYFRVGLSDINKFKVDVTPKMMKRAKYVDVVEVVKKIDALLRESNKPQLGFTKDYMPDTEWLYQMARYVDSNNVTSIFRHPIRGITNRQTDSDRVLVAQQAAEQELLVNPGLLGKRGVMNNLQKLCNKQRELSCRERQLDLLEKKGSKLFNKVKIDRREVESILLSTSIMIRNEMNHNSNGEEMNINEDERIRQLKKVKDLYELIIKG